MPLIQSTIPFSVRRSPRVKPYLISNSKSNLLHREDECSAIKNFVEKHLSAESPGALYISGGPGTGKTFCVSKVLDDLRSQYRFRRCLINCMDCSTPGKIFSQILVKSGYKESPRKVKDTIDLITDKIITPKKKLDMTVLVLDEIDELEAKNKEVLHELFSWPNMEKSRIIIIGISNTLDFTSRSLSRFNFIKGSAPTSLNFKPYSRQQIKDILSNRVRKMDSSSIIADSALELCSRKISALNGDLRQALSVLEKAVFLANKEHQSLNAMKQLSIENGSNGSQQLVPENSASFDVPVALKHVNQALTEVYSSKAMTVKTGQSSLPTQQQIALCVLLSLAKNGSHKDIDINKCHQTMLRVCKKKGLDSSLDSSSDFLNMLQLMEAKGLVEVKKTRGKEGQRSVALTVDSDEVERIMTDVSLLRSILSD